jgi:hypothetical protein
MPSFEQRMPTWRHLAEGNAKQARKRVAADVIIRDEAGRLLLVDPNYKPVEVALDALRTGRAVHAEEGHAVDGGGVVHHERSADPATRPRGSGG